MSTLNGSVNALLILSQLSDPDKDPAYDKIINTSVIVEFGKNMKGKGVSFILKLNQKL